MEEWRDVVGYEGLYQVSNLGRIKGLKDRWGNYREKILKLEITSQGYCRINLNKKGKGKKYMVHRLVAQAFIPNPNNLPQVNHINEIKNDNRVENLEWCTSEYNVNYGSRTERASKSNSKKVKCITTGEIFDSINIIKEKYNISTCHIGDCCKGVRKSCGKHPVTGEELVWEFIE